MKQHSHSRRDLLSFLSMSALASFLPEKSLAAGIDKASEYPNDIPHTIAESPWPVSLGNHRVQIHVENPADAVAVIIPWRRIDANPEKKAVLIFDNQGNVVPNLACITIAAEAGIMIYEAKLAGDYYVYYLPHAEPKDEDQLLRQIGKYLAPKQTSEATWRRRFASSVSTSSGAQWQGLPKARVIEFQARTSLDSFWPMEIAATDQEIKVLCERHSDPVLFFMEDRDHPIKMLDKVPYCWIQRGPQAAYGGEAFRGEFYVFQIGMYGNASANMLTLPASVDFSELTGADGDIHASAWWSSRNSVASDGPTNSQQEPLVVKPGEIQVLWCGVQVPLDAAPGKYRGHIYIKAGDKQATPIEFNLVVSRQFLRAGGDDQPWRLSRLKWLDSTIGSEDTVTPPYTPIEVQDQLVRCLGRQIRIGKNGLPVSIRVGEEEVLASPISFNVFRRSRAVEWKSTCKLEANEAAKATFLSVVRGDGYELRISTTIEFDGLVRSHVQLTSGRRQLISDIALEIPYVKNVVSYAAGMGLPGGERPQKWKWSWIDQPQAWKEEGIDLGFFCWLGSVDAGLYCRLRSPLGSWQNGHRGGANMQEMQDRVQMRMNCGPRVLEAGEVLNFTFDLLPTPAKPLSPDHWQFRYAHAYEPAADAQHQDATVINVHHSMMPNQYINYPFLNMDLLVPYVESAHELGIKVKLYYTMRELTTRLPELWAFRSLRNEIYDGPGVHGLGDIDANFWVQEHIRYNYSSGWVQPLPFGDIDTSLRIKSQSRLANFYLEGLRWLIEVPKIDGLYLDEIGYGRETMQRVRRVLDQRPGTMIDMHANHAVWSCNCPIGYYMEHLPYIDRLWLGEAFDPDSPPDFWLVEMSGLPFGLSSDMLERPNPWRGMLFGMTSRAHYSGAGGTGPTPIWKLWDSFGIQNAKTIGWWAKEKLVNTNRKDILATAYQREDKCLIAIASWAKSAIPVHLEINWNVLGLDPKTATITAPRLEGLQEERAFQIGEAIPVRPAKGWLLVVERGHTKLS